MQGILCKHGRTKRKEDNGVYTKSVARRYSKRAINDERVDPFGEEGNK